MAKLFIEYNNARHELEVDFSESVEVFQLQLMSLLEIDSSEVALLAIPITDASVPLRNLRLSDGDTVKVVKKSDLVSKAKPFVAPVVPENALNQSQMSQRIDASYSQTRIYEDKALQEKARAQVPIPEIQAAAKADSTSSLAEADRFLLHLLHWFKHKFFKWVNEPACSNCEGKTRLVGGAPPSPEEIRWQAFNVEVYQCQKCNSVTRFPRIAHPAEKLLQSRQGRCGEWANTFCLICRSLGLDVRHVVDWTDHVWTEVYSVPQQRWLHCDSCEDKLDTPLITHTWKPPAVRADVPEVFEATDVTPRYTRNWPSVASRRLLVPEAWLSKKLDIMNQMILGQLPSHFWHSFGMRKQTELAELERFKVESMDELELKPSELEGRISGSQAWKEARGEVGDPKKQFATASLSPNTPILFERMNFDGVWTKLEQFNQKAPVTLAPAELASIYSLISTLKSNVPGAEVPLGCVEALERALNGWTLDTVFPVLDLLRMIPLLKGGLDKLKAPLLLKLVLMISPTLVSKPDRSDQQKSNDMLVMKFLANCFNTSSPSGVVKAILPQIVECTLAMLGNGTLNASRAAAVVLNNISLLLLTLRNETVADRIFASALKQASQAQDSEVLARVLAAVVTLAPSQKAKLPSLKFELTAAIQHAETLASKSNDIQLSQNLTVAKQLLQ